MPLRRLASVTLLAGVAAAKTCPGSPSLVHAWTETEALIIAQNCKAVMSEMVARVNGQADQTWHDPHNNGTYKLLSQESDRLDFSRVTGNGKYTDKQTFTFEEQGCSGAGCICKVSGCSESQVTSIADFSTNYCDLRMLYCGAADGCKPVTENAKGFTVQETEVKSSLGASHNKGDCLKTAVAALPAPTPVASPPSTCPGSGSVVHAWTETSVVVGKANCQAVRNEMLARMLGQDDKSWHDPHNNGVYKLLSKTDSQLDFSRTTANGQYTDKQTFTFQDQGCGPAGCTCAVHGCSESQVFSIADFSTNYCDLRMLYCGSKEGCSPVTKEGKAFTIEETEVTSSLGASHDPTACLKTTVDLVV